MAMTFEKLPSDGLYFVLIAEGPQVLLYKSSDGKARRQHDSQEVCIPEDAEVQQVRLK